jgi:hypothetical protein
VDFLSPGRRAEAADYCFKCADVGVLRTTWPEGRYASFKITQFLMEEISGDW